MLYFDSRPRPKL